LGFLLVCFGFTVTFRFPSQLLAALGVAVMLVAEAVSRRAMMARLIADAQDLQARVAALGERTESHLVLEASLNLQVAAAIRHISQAAMEIGSLAEPVRVGKEWTMEHEGITKTFAPGRVTRVSDARHDTEILYEYAQDGSVTADTAVHGALRYRIRCTPLGAPVAGWVYDEHGNALAEFAYDELGQVTSAAARQGVPATPGAAGNPVEPHR